MKIVNKTLVWVGLIFAFVVCLPSEVFASTTTDEVIRTISPDLKNIVLKSVVPSSDREADYLMNGIVGKYIGKDIKDINYQYYAWCEGEGYTTCYIDMQSGDYKEEWDTDKQENVTISGEKIKYELTATYDVPSDKNIKRFEKYFSRLRNAKMDEVGTWYEVEDLSLINYYMTGEKSELWNFGAPGRALRYVKELNEITEGSDLNFYLDVRAGSQDEGLMYESAYGPMVVFYGDYAYSFKEEGLYLKRVIYIPEGTADTKEAYVEAAQERINDYLGSDNEVVVSYGGLLSSLDAGAEDSDKPITSDGNYYNVTVLGRTYKFYIVKADDQKLVKPSYNGKNIDTDISIKSDDSEVPLDTSIDAKRLTDGDEYDRIIGILDLDNNIIYDVKLYSHAKEDYITKLSNGTFNVKIPLPDNFKGKTLFVYYVDENGKTKKYDVTLDDDKKYAMFNTDHFSVYTLGYNDGIANPNTSDNLSYMVLVGVISLIVMMSSVLYLKKRSN